MSRITYTALRRIEPTGYARSAPNISAAASDSSINSTLTDLEGLLAGEWVLVSGFANAANNGWFQVLSNSTAGKIVVDATVVDEAIGANISIIGYVRGYGQVYEIEFNSTRIARPMRATSNTNTPRGGGQAEVLLHRIDDLIEITPTITSDTEAKQWHEILASLMAGELFTLDPYGTADAPIEDLTCQFKSVDIPDEVRPGLLHEGFSFEAQIIAALPALPQEYWTVLKFYAESDVRDSAPSLHTLLHTTMPVNYSGYF